MQATCAESEFLRHWFPHETWSLAWRSGFHVSSGIVAGTSRFVLGEGGRVYVSVHDAVWGSVGGLCVCV